MRREDFVSTDLEGAAYYAGIFDSGFDSVVEERVSRSEVEFDELVSELDVNPAYLLPVASSNPNLSMSNNQRS